jgi:Transglutaminase-like superfamily
MRQLLHSRKSILFLCIIVTLIVLSGAYIVEGLQAYSRYKQNILADQEHCGGQAPVHICVQAPTAIFSAFYPSYTATQAPLFTINYSSNQPLTLLISVSLTDFTQILTHTVTAESTTQASTFIPGIQEQALRGLTSEQSANLHVQVKDSGGREYYIDDIGITLHSRWLMEWIQADRLNIAAWVTPDDPAISELDSKATGHLQEEMAAPAAFIGYNKATEEQVKAQVDAIYDTLRLDYHMKYVQASVPYSLGEPGKRNVTQSVKLPAEVLEQRSGMCVELTLVMASAVEHIGLNAEIVIIPGHAFLGVADSPDNQQFSYWDAVAVNNNIAADSANVAADRMYLENQKKQTLVDTILVSDARDARIGPML